MFSSISKKSLLLIAITESASFIAYKFPSAEPFLFLLFVASFLLLISKNYQAGFYLLFLELFISPKGRHLDFVLGNFSISLRMAMWFIVMTIWLFSILQERKVTIHIKETFFKREYYIFYGLFVFILFGLCIGFINHHSARIIYSDINAWLYYTLIFPIISNLPWLRNNKRELLDIFIVAAFWVSFKTILMAYIFSHSFLLLKINLYEWTRRAGLGEISNMPNGFVRVFFQTQIFPLILIFYYLTKIFMQKIIIFKNNYLDFIGLTILLAVSILSWARSNWVGLIVVLIFFYVIIFIINKRKAFYNLALLITGTTLAIALVFGVINFPYPRQTADFDINDLKDRMATVEGEAAVSSRWSLLPVLKNTIIDNPIFGKGFGFEVSYKSSDPRVLERNPDGVFKTYIYEWGWLDLWLKLGLPGALVYFCIIYKLSISGITKKINNKEIGNVFSENSFFSLGMLMIAGIHFFSPYLNHPLGIGFVLFAFIFHKNEISEGSAKIKDTIV